MDARRSLKGERHRQRPRRRIHRGLHSFDSNRWNLLGLRRCRDATQVSRCRRRHARFSHWNHVRGSPGCAGSEPFARTRHRDAVVNDPATRETTMHVEGAPIPRNTVDTVGLATQKLPWVVGAGSPRGKAPMEASWGRWARSASWRSRCRRRSGLLRAQSPGCGVSTSYVVKSRDGSSAARS